MSKQKAKGTRFEGEVRDRLNEVEGVEAKRVVGSGMFAQGDETSEFYGDVRAKTRVGELVIECKIRARSMWKTLVDWLGGEDVLVVRENRGKTYVFMGFDLFIALIGGVSATISTERQETAADALRRIADELERNP